ncbi:PREDICTED: protein Lines homolog isoform X5 [Priapulus caudatus]|uniref:Protein Lines homolog isoform X5 n=1 Tax=Priapulus caudatus TaxID=37621 RepID=A0ABM1E311_PRICU|nr:PREDICTED: protein Lines homolog isoform X5 [Priapulus caudatus]
MLTNLQIANGCICDCNQIALHKIMSEFIDGEPCNNNHEETLQRLSAITIVLETFSPCNAWTNLRNVCASRRCVKTLLTTLCAENRYISYESELASVAALTSSIMGKEEMRYFLHQVILKLVQQTQGNFQQIILLDVLSHSLSTCYFEYSETRCLPQTCPTARQHPVSHKESLTKSEEVALMKTSSSMFKMVIALLSRHRLVVRPNSCSWVQQLYGDQDDELIDMMMELLKLYTFMAPAHSEVTDAMSPHIIFSQFLEMISFDHQVLLDLLISNETNFLEYLTRYLRLVSNDRESFFGHLSAVNGYRRCCPGLSVLNAWRGMRLPASTAPSPAEREALCNQASGHFSCAATCHDESSEHGETPLLVRLCAYSDSDGSDVEADVDSATSLLQETHSQTKNLLLNTHTVISNDSEDVGPNIGFYPAKTIAGNAACTTECNDHVIHQYCSTLASKKMDEREKNYAKKGMQKEQTHAEMSDSSHACLRDTACQGVEQHVVNTLKKLLISVERLQKRGLFPYHAGPLCRRLANVCK